MYTDLICFIICSFLVGNNYILSNGLQEILLVLDGTTGLNMLQQAREFNDVITAPDNSVSIFMVIRSRGLLASSLKKGGKGGLLVMLYSLGSCPGCRSHWIHPDKARWHCARWLCGRLNFVA